MRASRMGVSVSHAASGMLASDADSAESGGGSDSGVSRGGLGPAFGDRGGGHEDSGVVRPGGGGGGDVARDATSAAEGDEPCVCAVCAATSRRISSAALSRHSGCPLRNVMSHEAVKY